MEQGVGAEGQGTPLLSLGMPPTQHFSLFTDPASQTLHLGIFMEVLLHRHDWSSHQPFLTDSTFSSSSPLPGGWGWSWKLQPTTHALVFLASGPGPKVLKPSKGHQQPVILSAYPSTAENGLLWIKQNKTFLSSLSLRKFQGAQKLMCREPGPNIQFSYIIVSC